MNEVSTFKTDIEGIPTIKLVIYGPAEAGKSTLIELYSILKKMENPHSSGKLTSIKNPFEETALFDQNTFTVDGRSTKDTPLLKYRIYCVAGQDRYRKTREVVLNGTEGILILLDFNKVQRERTKAILRELKENMGRVIPEDTPIVFAVNKMDLPETEKMKIEEIKEIIRSEGFENEEVYGISCLDAKDALLEVIQSEDRKKFFDEKGRFRKEMRPEPVKRLIQPIFELTRKVVSKKAMSAK